MPVVPEVKDGRVSWVVSEAASWELAAVEASAALGASVPLPDFFATLYHSLGISPMAIAMLLTSPTRALMTADMGSHGCSSVSYS